MPYVRRKMKDVRARRALRANKEAIVKKGTLGRAALLVMMAAMLLTGCVGGEARIESERVELGTAESARVQIKMSAGGLVIHGGAEDLMEAEFIYNYESWKPEVEYMVRGSEGLLTITHPSQVGAIGFPGVDYEWDLRFNNEVPTEVDIDMGVGGCELQRGGLNLGELNIDLGVGGADVDLTGEWEADLEASIKAGVGGLQVTLPREVGVRVQAKSGLGAVEAPGFNRDGGIYTNDAYGRTDVTLDITLEVGVGGIGLSQRG
jgi:hypothetical protein